MIINFYQTKQIYKIIINQNYGYPENDKKNDKSLKFIGLKIFLRLKNNVFECFLPIKSFQRGDSRKILINHEKTREAPNIITTKEPTTLW